MTVKSTQGKIKAYMEKNGLRQSLLLFSHTAKQYSDELLDKASIYNSQAFENDSNYWLSAAETIKKISKNKKWNRHDKRWSK